MPRGLAASLPDLEQWAQPSLTDSFATKPRQTRHQDFLLQTGPQLPTSFRCTKKPEPPPGPKICWHYPGEDTSQAFLTPPEDPGVHTTDVVNKAWKMKVQKFIKVMTYFGGGLLVGGTATLLRRSIQECCPPGSINWATLCDPTSWFAEEESKTAAAAAAATGVAPGAKGRPKFKAKAKPKARGRADDEESYSYEDEDD
mmetsp:Transcript_3943/g.7103  ORF Transcript_3943/g.7103 Transcript_3943/m.7103 type:complete len:199 (-) Transcript_3943:16-612(-)